MALYWVRNTLLAAVCLQLMLSTGSVLSISTSHGHGSWNDKLCSAGKSQSPVDIIGLGLKEEKIPPLVFDEYDVPFDTLINPNDFHVALQYPADKAFPVLRGGSLPGEYIFSGLHFHWGPEGHKGSEHRLEGVQFDGELHMVHYNSIYDTIEEALRHSDGVAVTATWLQEANETTVSKDISRSFGYQWLKKLADNFGYSDKNGNTRSETDAAFAWEPIALTDLITARPDHFFRYNGSLTTSPCSESVVWTVFRSPLTVPSEFMKMLRQRETSVRAPLPLNNRTILYGGDMMSYHTGGGLATAPSGLWMIPSLITLFKMAA